MSYIPSITLPAFIFNSPAASILLPVGGGLASGYLSAGDTKEQQKVLKKPALQPPDYVFGSTWTILYGMMGYSAYRAWSVGLSSVNPLTVEDAQAGATLYTMQLALNFVWVPLFFRFRQGLVATVDVIALTSTVGYLTYTWSKVDRIASYCLIPYLGWLSFATYLTIKSCLLNGWDLKGTRMASDENDKGSKTQ